MSSDSIKNEDIVKAGYRCRRCGVESMEVPVRERFPNEHILYYLQKVVAEAVKTDHELRSPLCPCKEVDLAIPMSENGIGFAGPEPSAECKAKIMQELRKTPSKGLPKGKRRKDG